MPPLKISVIIVNYNVCYFLEQTLISVYKALKNISGEVFVVDNASVDSSVEMVKKLFPSCILIENEENLGFSKANNQAIKKAQGEYILLLNPDTVVQENTFTSCCEYLDNHPYAGALGVKMVDGKGEFLPESKRGLPTPLVALYKIVGLSALFPKSKTFGRYYLGYLDTDEINEVDVLSGAFLLVRSSLIEKIGGLDESYFMYGEDIDFSYRIKQAGFKNIYFPQTQIIHYKGESTRKSSINYVFVFYGAMILFAKKHFTGTKLGILSLLIQTTIYVRAFLAILKRFFDKIYLFTLNFIVCYGGLYFISSFWQGHFKPTSSLFPAYYFYFILPVYIFVWFISVYFSGGFDKKFRIFKIFRGVFLGVLLISALSNFIDASRFSKSIIVLGGIWVLIALILIRYFILAIRNRRFDFEIDFSKKTIIVGSVDECKRVSALINKFKISVSLIGYIATDKSIQDFENYLGNLDHINDLIKIYKPDEIIFCAQNIPAESIIQLMTNIDSKLLDYKIVPDSSNFIIGSNSKNLNGEFYTLEVELSIISQENIRNKRVFDVLGSLFFLTISPFMCMLLPNSRFYLSNMFKVFIGKYSLVGFAKENQIHLSKIKKGILSTISEFEYMNLNENTINKLDILYAKNYKTSDDLNIVLKNIKSLGKKVKA
jgi:GT2 family glycosyltransferase